MNHKNNLRSHKTEITLQKALIELLKNKSIEKITVTEIANYANIHRGTFYLHYKDVYDLFLSVEDNFTNEYNHLFLNYLDSEKRDFKDFSTKLYKHILTYSHILKTMLITEQSELLNKLSKFAQPEDFKIWKTRFRIGNKDNYLYYYASLISSLNSLIYNWIENDFDISPEALAAIAQDILNGYEPINY